MRGPLGATHPVTVFAGQQESIESDDMRFVCVRCFVGIFERRAPDDVEPFELEDATHILLCRRFVVHHENDGATLRDSGLGRSGPLFAPKREYGARGLRR